MRITDITNKFVDLRSCRGVYMKAEWQDGVMALSNTYGENPLIAEIFDYRDSKNFRLRLHPYTGRRYNSQSFKNRIDAVLWSVQVEDKSKRWGDQRYYSYIRDGLTRIWDSNLRVEYDLSKGQMELVLKNGQLTLDYSHLESLAFPDKPTPVVELETNSNLQTLDNKLNAILAGV